MDRVLATVVFTDIVGSTRSPPGSVTASGAGYWTNTIRRHSGSHRATRPIVKSTGDGVLATFDGPARAARFAAELHAARRAARSRAARRHSHRRSRTPRR